MYRNISDTLKQWKETPNHKPLVIIGARQVGKTYSVRELAREYAELVEINFQDDVKARSYFGEQRSSDDIVSYLELNYLDITFSKETLVFFDEVQLVPELLTSLKFLPSKLKCDIVCSGSMLGVKLHKSSSWPVGYTEVLTMYPMTFFEFAKAVGIEEKYFDVLDECIEDVRAVPVALHDRMRSLFSEYMVCGGLPEAVNAYVSKGLAAAVRVNRNLANDYRVDIAHYADSRTKIKAQECFDSLPNQLAKDNKKFRYNLVRQGYNARFYEESLNWLENAGLVYRVNRVGKIEMPLKAYKELSIFKIYMFDTGLLASQFSDADLHSFLDNAMGTYKGMLYENIAAQTLAVLGMPAYYYEPNTSSEIDFIIEGEDGITPLELKGGLHTRSRSFDNFIKNHGTKRAYKFSQKNIGENDNGVVRNYPVYVMEKVLRNPIP